MSWIEIISAVLGLTCVFLAGRNSKYNFWVGYVYNEYLCHVHRREYLAHLNLRYVAYSERKLEHAYLFLYLLYRGDIYDVVQREPVSVVDVFRERIVRVLELTDVYRLLCDGFKFWAFWNPACALGALGPPKLGCLMLHLLPGRRSRPCLPFGWRRSPDRAGSSSTGSHGYRSLSQYHCPSR